MHSLSFQIPEVNREDEVERITARLAALPAGNTAEGDRQTKIFTMTWNEPTTTDDIRDALTEIGYTPDLPQPF